MELEKVQKPEGLNLGTKVGTRLVQWFRKKMKGKLAAQTLSWRVADALEYLQINSNNKKNYLATINFIKKVNDLFDVLNSRKVINKSYKAPVNATNKDVFMKLFDDVEIYFRDLKEYKTGKCMLRGGGKTGFLGFITCMKSFKSLYKDLCDNVNSNMKFLLTYKFSQDHF